MRNSQPWKEAERYQTHLLKTQQLNKGLEIWNELRVERKAENLLSLDEIVKIAQDNEMHTITKRALRYYAFRDIIRKPAKIGKNIYHDKDYIFNAIACLLLLKQQYCLPLRLVKMALKDKSTDQIISILEEIKNNKFKDRITYKKTAGAITFDTIKEEK